MSFKVFIAALFAGLLCLSSTAYAKAQTGAEIPESSQQSLSDIICGLPGHDASAKIEIKELRPIGIPADNIFGVSGIIHKCEHSPGILEMARDHGCCVKNGHHGSDGVPSNEGFHVIGSHSQMFLVDTTGALLISDTPFYISENTAPPTQPPTRS
jgi:hypothetical protein